MMDPEVSRIAIELFADSVPRQIETVATPIDRLEVRRYMGYPARSKLNPRIEAELDQWVAEAANLAAPRASYAVFPVADLGRRHVRIGTAHEPFEFHGAIGEFLGPIGWLAVFIATAGPRLEELAVKKLRAGNALAGLILNAVGAERAEAAESAVIDELTALCAPAELALTLPYSPGYCGMDLTEQRTLFALLDGGQVGVSLNEACLMSPLKSVSGLIGVGPAPLITRQGSPCDRCELRHCDMRR